MSLVALVALFGWVPVVLCLFMSLPPRRAVLVAYVAGWLILPATGIVISGLPNYTKVTAVAYGVVLGAVLFDMERLSQFRPRWFDLPILIWTLCPFASSISNDLGAYDGASGVLNQIIVWGIPYFIGRVYFRDLEDLRELVVALYLGGLFYIPFCLLELRIGGQLNSLVYGIGRWTGSKYGLYNPVVFLSNALEVGMWMTASSLAGAWLWVTGQAPRLGGLPAGPPVAALLVTAVLCHQTGALVLLAAGLALLLISRRLGRSWLIWLLILTPFVYVATRASGLWSGQQLVELSRTILNESRAGSLAFRLKNEDMLADRALQRPVLGWGGWGRNRVYNEAGRDLTVVDGLWVYILGVNGFVGLGSETLVLILPLVLLCLRTSGRDWSRDDLGAAAMLGVLLGLYQVDCLVNAMLNPIYVLIAGALMGLRIPNVARPPLLEVATAIETYQALALDGGGQTPTEATRRRHAEALGAADQDLEWTLWATEQSAMVADDGEALVIGLIQEELELVRRLRAAGLDSEAISAYQRALDRGERLLSHLAKTPLVPRVGAGPGESGEPVQAESIAACWERAIVLWKRFDAIAPGIPEIRAAWAEACNNLAWRLALDPTSDPDELERARDLARTAVTLSPDQFSHWNTLALALVRCHDLAEAAEALDQSSRLIGTPSPFNLYVSAIIRAHRGDRSAAHEALRLADSLALHLTPAARADLQALRSEAVDGLETRAAPEEIPY